MKWSAAFLAWTLFVWVGRIRNALADTALDAAGRTGPLLLATSFVLPALVLAVALVLRWRGRPVGWLAPAMTVFAVWTTGVWIVRAGDIALGGDHPVAFVVVHTVLAVVSIALAWLAVRSLRATPVSAVEQQPVPS
ncbi:MAG: hypothetical protein ACOYOP_01335 [Microthrixaceae bacterium]